MACCLMPLSTAKMLSRSPLHTLAKNSASQRNSLLVLVHAEHRSTYLTAWRGLPMANLLLVKCLHRLVFGLAAYWVSMHLSPLAPDIISRLLAVSRASNMDCKRHVPACASALVPLK